MSTIPKPKMGGNVAGPTDITQTLAHHDAAIATLGGRMTGVETGLKTLQGEVHHGFANVTQNVNQQLSSVSHTVNTLGSKIDKLDAQPKFDFHKIVGTVVSIAVLFTMICGGIIYITNSQNAAIVAEQKAFNGIVAKSLERHENKIDEINGWRATIIPAIPAPARAR